MLQGRKVKILFGITLVVLAIAPTICALGGTGQSDEESMLRVAVLHYGPIGDFGWTYEGHIGAQQMAEALPYVELVEHEAAAGPCALPILHAYAKTGSNIIFCHGWGMDLVPEIATNYPSVIFMCGGGHGRLGPNVGTYYGRTHGARFLAGMVAAAMTKANMIGYAAAHPLPRVIAGINAFARGVASVNPKAKVYVEWIGEWYDPAAEKAVSLSLIDSGCDVITHDSDSPAAGEAAQERNAYYIANHGEEMQRFAQDVYLTGLVWNWASMMTDIVEAVHNGTWNEDADRGWWYGLAEGGVVLVPMSDLVPDDVAQTVDAKARAIVTGDFVVFPEASEDNLWTITYLDPNIVGELP